MKVLQANRPWPSDLAMIVAPGLQMVDEKIVGQMEQYVQANGNLVLTCRTAWMDKRGQLFEGPIARPILKLIGASIEAYDSMPEQTVGQVEMDGKNIHGPPGRSCCITNPRRKSWPNIPISSTPAPPR